MLFLSPNSSFLISGCIAIVHCDCSHIYISVKCERLSQKAGITQLMTRAMWQRVRNDKWMPLSLDVCYLHKWGLLEWNPCNERKWNEVFTLKWIFFFAIGKTAGMFSSSLGNSIKTFCLRGGGIRLNWKKASKLKISKNWKKKILNSSFYKVWT